GQGVGPVRGGALRCQGRGRRHGGAGAAGLPVHTESTAGVARGDQGSGRIRGCTGWQVQAVSRPRISNCHPPHGAPDLGTLAHQRADRPRERHLLRRTSEREGAMKRETLVWTVLFLVGGLFLVYRGATSPHGFGKAYVKQVPVKPRSQQDTRMRWIDANP